jgi:hypothetical protein
MLNADAKDLSLSQLNYQTVKNSILAMKKFEIEIANTSEKQEEEEEHIYEKNEKFSIKEKLSGLIDIHVKPWLLESEKV